MTKLRALLVGALIALATASPAIYSWAQQITSTTLTGNEVGVFAIGGPGGPSLFVPVSQLRNASALKTFSGSGAQTYTALPTDSVLYWVGTAPTTWTITTPANPVDGEIIQIATDTTLTTRVTLTANTGQTLNTALSSATISANTSVEYMYSLATTKWYQLR